MMPSLFISHGSPYRVLGESSAKSFLMTFAPNIPKPKAIVIFSAHWFSTNLQVTKNETTKTLHDFMGFPEELYEVNYQAPQPKWLYQQITELLEEENIKYQATSRGLDHGAWSVLSLCYPKGEIPVIGLSLPSYQTLKEYLTLGGIFRKLRANNILIIGSGSATHNLSKLSYGKKPEPWAIEFTEWLQNNVLNNNYQALTELYQSHPLAKIAHPTPDHYIPLLVAAGAAINEPVTLIHDSYELSNLNNSCFQFG